ncbi:unnamed protein product [Lactuca virosa]|uniref:RING-type E3 ubiquitin transferase n=1 Tax=Lactuca virosa TaxID=75947 RepID=A0AAU9LMF0_9ASTR|nr:unnamed protein product [Lactuca virosa]
MSTTPTNAPPPTIPYTSPPITVILTIILLLFFFIGFFSIYFCRCFMQNLFYTWHRQSPSRAPRVPGTDSAAPGLDPSIIKTFPTFPYSSVKEYRRENYGLECAICLCEFKDENVLRLLTKCCHVFHQECIDLWLGSHKSCPCCRSSLDTPINSPEKSPVSLDSGHGMNEVRENGSNGDSVSIDIRDTNEINGDRDESKMEKHVVIKVNEDREGERTQKTTEGFGRSKSTGHSIVKKNKGCENDERFTLRLPQDVQAKLIPRHNWTRSCTEFGEYKSKTSSSNAGFGEVTLDRDERKA